MSLSNSQATAAASTAVIIKQNIVQKGCGSGCGVFLLIVAVILFFVVKSCMSDYVAVRDRALHEPPPQAHHVADREPLTPTAHQEQPRATPAPATAKPAATLPAAKESGTWKAQKNTDELTDKITFTFYTPGTRVEIDELLHYLPLLVVNVIPSHYDIQDTSVSYAYKVGVVIETEGFMRDRTPVAYRIDDRPATAEMFETSSDRRTAFFPKSNLLAEMKNAKTLIVRYETTLGNVRTTTFELEGLADAIAAQKNEMIKALGETPPPTVTGAPEVDDAEAVKARKEKAAHAVALPESDVDERIADLTRAYAEKKLHPKRLKLLDLKHYPHKSGTVWIQRFDADGKTWRTGYLERPTGELNHIPPQELKDYLPRR